MKPKMLSEEELKAIEQAWCPVCSCLSRKLEALMGHISAQAARIEELDARVKWLEDIDPKEEGDGNIPLSREDAVRLCKMQGECIREQDDRIEALQSLVREMARHWTANTYPNRCRYCGKNAVLHDSQTWECNHKSDCPITRAKELGVK